MCVPSEAGNAVVKLLLYAGRDVVGRRLAARVRPLVSAEALVHCDTIEEFVRCLRRPLDGEALVIAMASDLDVFQRLLDISGLMRGVKTVLILPDRHAETVSAALKLHPRYLTDIDSDFLDVAMVAARILSRASAAEGRLPPGDAEGGVP